MTIKRIDRGNTHWYTVDGKKADGVTTLLSKGLAKPWLGNWAAKMVAEHVADNLSEVAGMEPLGRDAIVAALKQTPWSKRDKAGARGTEVHKIAEKLTHGEEVDVPDEIAGYVESCVRFLDEWKIEPIVTEVTVASRKWNYCGTLDLVGKLPDGRVLLADYKTSASGIYAETVLQQAAYRFAEVYLGPNGEEIPVESLGITDCAGVWITDRHYEVFPLPSDERAFKDFLHVAWCARWAATSKELIGPSVTAPEWLEVAS
jgi:hypothetical protein